MRELLHDQMGIDAFALDGDEAEPVVLWQEKRRVLIEVPRSASD